MVNIVVDFLVANPLVLLFAVIAIGYPLGRIKIGGNSLGTAAILFVGLAFGALSPNLKLPDLVYQMGLAVFVYTVGLSSGPDFFRSLRRRGLASNALIAITLIFMTLATFVLVRSVHMDASQAAGLYAGSLTNTPALSAVIESLKLRGASGDALELLLSQPVVGYSIAYPGGVIGMILMIGLMRRICKPDFAKEAAQLHSMGLASDEIVDLTLRVTDPAILGRSIAQLANLHAWRVVLVRRQRHVQGDRAAELVSGTTQLALDDCLSVIGTQADIRLAAQSIGAVIDERSHDHVALEYRDVLVSNMAMTGRRVRNLALQIRHGALITRVRRGDVEMLADGNTVLEPGDSVRVVALREHMRDIATLFGDSQHELSEVNWLTLGLGLVLGLLLGHVPIPMPGGSAHLGLAGGPLVVALICGALKRSGPLVWTIPQNANRTLRQFGLVLFLSAIGIRSGYAFVSTLMSAGGLALLGIGAAITLCTAFVTLFVGYKLMKMPMSLLTGILAGLQTNPAVLSFATQQSNSDVPNVGYATVYPVAMIAKIMLAQALLIALS